MNMKQLFSLFTAVLLLLSLAGCASSQNQAQIAATTLPVYEFTSRLCDGTGLSVTRLVTENVSCLHDYTLNVSQVKAAESAEVVERTFSGSLPSFIAAFTKNKRLTQDEIAEIQAIIDAHSK